MGKRRYGKTIWLEYVLSKVWEYFPAGGYVFTKTKHNQFWQKHFPETRIYEQFDHEVVMSILANQKLKLEKFLKTGTFDECPYVVVILDDMMSDKLLRYDDLLNRFIFAGRHFFIFFAVCQQDVKGLGPAIRNNFDLIALTYQTQQRSMKSVQDDYADLFDDGDFVRNLIRDNTQDHQMLLIDQSEAHYDAADIFYVDKAPDPEKDPVKPYRIGSDKFWKESGCDWKKQLKRSKRFPKKEKEEWLKVAKRQYNREKHSRMEMQPEGEGSDVKFTTNQIGLAPPEIQAQYHEELRRKMGLDKSHLTTALETLDSLFDFVPGSKNGW
jgi:hypothetical protein